MLKKRYLLLIGILSIHLLLLVFLKFTAWPEMSLWPYLMTKGLLPYSNIAIAHTPLMLVDLAVFYKVFGVGIMQLKIFTWLLILIFDGVLFAFVKKLWNIKTAFIALCAFIVWNLFYDGNGLWFDLYMSLFAFCSFYFVKQKKWFWTGIFWGLAFLSKQTAVWFLIPIGLELVQSTGNRVRSAWKLIFGTVVVGITFILSLLVFNLLPDFWNWAVNFGIFILPKAQGQIQLPGVKTLLVSLLPFSIFIPLIAKSRKYLLLLLWTIAGMLGAYPRFEYFHFQPAIPYLAIATGLVFIGLNYKKGFVKLFVPVYLITSCLLFARFFLRNVNEGTRFYETDVSEVVSFVNYSTKAGDTILVLNWWDNIYALTETLPATNPWVPQLSWYMEIPGVQERMVESMIQNPPKLIIYKPYTSLGLSAYIPKKVYNYVTENYKIGQKVNGIEILIPNK